MAETYAIKVELRNEHEMGSKACRRLRRAGSIPVVLYGRGQDTIPLKVSANQFQQALASRAHVFELQWDSNAETALIQESQQDPVRDEVLHVDFIRVSLFERVTVSVQIVLHGEPKGVQLGGILNHLLHEIEVECLPTEIPESIRVEIAHMEIDQELLVSELKVDPSVQILTNKNDIVVAVQRPALEQEEAAPAEEAPEPEVISKAAPEAEEEEPETKEKKEK